MRKNNSIRKNLNCAAMLMLVFLTFNGSVRASQIDIQGPLGSNKFGESVTVLPNGNIVITDPYYDLVTPSQVPDVGAVFLYDATTLQLISTVTGSNVGDRVGSGGISVLSNGNYLISSPYWQNPIGETFNAGAVTFGNSTSGVSGRVSKSNSLVGSSFNDNVGSNGSIILLTNGSYVISSSNWDNTNPVMYDVGAATFGNGTTGVSGEISSSNSLIGSTAYDRVGAVTALTNGNYVVRSPFWDGIPFVTPDAGAVTFGNGTTGISGTISSSNSLVGTTAASYVGVQVTALTNGNYVVRSPDWDDASLGISNAGAVTFGNGKTGIKGTISGGNSLIGSANNDIVGNAPVVALNNGNYVVISSSWSSKSPVIAGVGAVTFGNGTTGTSGVVSSSNSLVGSSTYDNIGFRVTTLTNGNYVVSSPDWKNPVTGAVKAGAATFGNGTTGISGIISSSNSLVGSTPYDNVGNSVVSLGNGNYVVSSPNWDNISPAIADVGAVTFGHGTSGVSGTISNSNSLVGSTPYDRIGTSVNALNNGNYVVRSPEWDSTSPATVDVGAATFGNGTTGISGTISGSNSLVGSTANDKVGSGIFFATLPNGNYVLISPDWDSTSPAIADAGAATFGSGTTGITGIISSSNSLVGSSTGDFVGAFAAELTNGNYVVRSAGWDSTSPAIVDAGAVTFANGETGISGTISSSNSLVGSSVNDSVGNGNISALSNGNYIVRSSNWDNTSSGITDAGAFTFGNGVTGTVGTINNTNSVLGTAPNGVSSYTFDLTYNRLIVGRGASNTVSILFFNTTAVADGDLNDASTFDNGVPNALVNAVIPSGRTVTISSVMNIGLVMVQCGGNLSGGSETAYVVGGVRKNYCGAAGESFLYPIGDPDDYSPLTVSNTNGTGNLTAMVIDETLFPLPSPISLSRYWRLNGSGITTDLSFTYTNEDVNGNESAYRVYRRSGTNLITQVNPHTINTATNTATVTGISQFSLWGIGNSFLPTAASVAIGGRVITPEGKTLRNARVTLTDNAGISRTALTTTFGYYRFADVAAGETYTISVASKRYSFAPQIVNVTEELTDLNFIAAP